MLLWIIRMMFFLAMAAVGYDLGASVGAGRELAGMVAFMVAGAVVITLDTVFRRKNIRIVTAVFFGLVAGLVVATVLGPVVDMSGWIGSDNTKQAAKLGIAAMTAYLAIALILQTKDDFRFIIPYIEFSKQQKGGRPLLLDTSVIIDGRIADIAETRILDAPLAVPRFVLRELQSIADSSDKLKRNRGRRGLDILNRLQGMTHIDISILDAPAATAPGDGVDQMLISLAAEVNGRVVTNDYNLNKVAKFRGVDVINVNDLANALKPAFLPGETMDVAVLKPGQEDRQGVGYLEDGTMVVVEDGKEAVGKTVTIAVTSVLQTSAGRMIFGRLEGKEGGARPRGH
jgi:uncharacterized protein YacL